MTHRPQFPPCDKPSEVVHSPSSTQVPDRQSNYFFSALKTVVASIPSACLVTASAGFGAVFAYQQGITHGPVLAGLSVTMALGLECAKPMAVSGAFQALGSWRTLGRVVPLTILATVAIAFSLTAELQLMARSRSDGVAGRQEQQTKATTARTTRDRLASEFRALATPSRSTAEITPLIEAKMATRRDLDACEGTFIANVSARAVCAEVSSLKAELAKADRYELAKAAYERAEAAAGEVAEVVADPGAVALASYLKALGFKVDAAQLGDWLVLVGVIALEAGSSLAGVLMSSMANTDKEAVSTRVHRPQTPEPFRLDAADTTDARPLSLAPPTADAADTIPLQPIPVVSKDAVADRLLAVVREQGGEMKASVRSLASRIGAKPATLHTAAAGLVAAGVLAMEVSRSGTVFKVIGGAA